MPSVTPRHRRRSTRGRAAESAEVSPALSRMLGVGLAYPSPMGLGGHSRRRAVAAALVLVAPAALAGSATSAVRAPEAAPSFARYVPVSPGTSCVPDNVAGVVNGIAWEEIERLGDRGLPVCDVEWRFVPDRDKWWWWGYTVPASSPGERATVLLIEDAAAYAVPGEEAIDGDLLEQHVRTTVRHEFGHALTHLLELDDANLAALFPAELEISQDATGEGYEASAEAIAAALTPDDEERTIFYDEDVSAENVRMAELVLGAFVTD